MPSPMNNHGGPRHKALSFLTHKPLQASKLVGISLVLVLGIAGFLRLANAAMVIDNPLFADGQFLAVLFIPLASLALIGIVVLETLVSGYRVLRSERSIRTRVAGRPGYLLVRGVETAAALLGAVLIVFTAPILFAESTPAPAGVALMVALMVVGFGVLVASLVRAVLELYWFDPSS